MPGLGRPRVPRVSVPCAGCGVMVERRETEVRYRRTFCTIECGRRSGLKPRTGTERKCETCGVLIYVPPSQPRKRFCSNACQSIGQLRGELRNCQTCGVEFRITPSIESRKFCSHKCAAEATMQRPQERQHNGRPVLKDRAGYVKVYEPEHPRSYGGWVFEHRLVAERRAGRYLGQAEHVHHINGIKDDNRLENLVVLSHSSHSHITQQERLVAQRTKDDELAEYRRRFGPLPKE